MGIPTRRRSLREGIANFSLKLGAPNLRSKPMKAGGRPRHASVLA
jgi:hypothetical protein